VRADRLLLVTPLAVLLAGAPVAVLACFRSAWLVGAAVVWSCLCCVIVCCSLRHVVACVVHGRAVNYACAAWDVWLKPNGSRSHVPCRSRSAWVGCRVGVQGGWTQRWTPQSGTSPRPTRKARRRRGGPLGGTPRGVRYGRRSGWFGVVALSWTRCLRSVGGWWWVRLLRRHRPIVVAEVVSHCPPQLGCRGVRCVLCVRSCTAHCECIVIWC